MPREKKPIVIEQYHDRDRDVKVDICYNPNPHCNYHQATIQQETFTHTEIAKVRAWVRQRIADLYSVAWQAVIEVEYDTGVDRYGPFQKVGLRVSYDRYWVGRLGSGKLRKARWGTEAEKPWHWDRGQGDDTPQDHRIENSEGFRAHGDMAKVEFALPLAEKRAYDNKTTYYYPYSEELWEGLGKVKAEIERIAALLKDMLAVEGDAYLALASIGQGLLLPSGAKEDQEA